MKCAVLGCPSQYSIKNSNVSFHRFPSDEKVFDLWVAATGRSEFVPNHRSKICSRHFEKTSYAHIGSKYLKPDAFPTKLLTNSCHITDYERTISEEERGIEESGPTAYSTDVDSVLKQVTSSVEELPPAPKSLVSKFDNVCSISHSSSSAELPSTQQNKFPLQVLQAENSTIKSSVSIPQTSSFKQAAKSVKPKKHQLLNEKNIKVVDMKTILCPQTTSNQFDDQVILNSPSKIKNVDGDRITVCQIHKCLRNLLPGNFDMSRLIPNDKLASLIIRYLKLKETNQRSHTEIVNRLQIILEATKSNEKKYSNHSEHPFLSIEDEDLQSALSKVLPEDFSMADVTDDVLKFICVALNQEIYLDGFTILREKISRISNGKNEDNNISYKSCESNTLTEEQNRPSLQKDKDEIEFTERISDLRSDLSHKRSKNVQLEAPRTEPIFVDVNKSCQSDSDYSDNEIELLPENDTIPSATPLKNLSLPSKKRKLKLKRENGVWKPKNQLFLENNSDFSDIEQNESFIYKKRKLKSNEEEEEWKPENEKQVAHGINRSRKLVINKRQMIHPVEDLELLVKYLDDNKSSARDMLSSFNLMFYLCRFLHIKTRSANVKKLKASLLYIMENNINSENVGSYLEDFNNQRTLIPEMQNKNKTKSSTAKRKTANNDKDKLKLTPIVVLHNLIDYSIDQMLFMTKAKKSNSFCNRVSVTLNQNPDCEIYTTDYVRKVTESSYKKFRKIITKKNGNTVIFRLKYMILSSGTVVFAKYFKNPHWGWRKGVIKNLFGLLRYQVQLDSGDLWLCDVDQLRPLFQNLPNTIEECANYQKRSIKPKKLFDL